MNAVPRDVRDMSALELLDYLDPGGAAGSTPGARPDLATIKYFTDRGLYDLDWIEANQGLRGELESVPAELRTPEKLALVARTGAAAAARDPERIAAWADVADALTRLNGLADVEFLLEELQAAGRSPAEALELAGACSDVQSTMPRPEWALVTLDMFGLARDITGETFRMLAASPLVTDYACDYTVARYRELGFAVEHMPDLSRAGLGPEHIEYGLAIDADARGWADLAGLPSGWLTGPPRPLRGLLALQAAGWTDGISGEPGLLTELAAAGITDGGQVAAWDAALRGGTRLPHEGSPLERAGEIVKLAAAGVRRSAVGEYRLCGARTLRDFLRIFDTGLSVAQCAEVRRRHGQPSGAHGVRVFPDVERFLAAARAR